MGSAGRDLTRKRRSAERRETHRRDRRNHLAHAAKGSLFNALCRRHEEVVRTQVRRERRDRLAEVLRRRDREQHLGGRRRILQRSHEPERLRGSAKPGRNCWFWRVCCIASACAAECAQSEIACCAAAAKARAPAPFPRRPRRALRCGSCGGFTPNFGSVRAIRRDDVAMVLRDHKDRQCARYTRSTHKIAPGVEDDRQNCRGTPHRRSTPARRNG